MKSKVKRIWKTYPSLFCHFPVFIAMTRLLPTINESRSSKKVMI
jgi:hypothetical protein